MENSCRIAPWVQKHGAKLLTNPLIFHPSACKYHSKKKYHHPFSHHFSSESSPGFWEFIYFPWLFDVFFGRLWPFHAALGCPGGQADRTGGPGVRGALYGLRDSDVSWVPGDGRRWSPLRPLGSLGSLSCHCYIICIYNIYIYNMYIYILCIYIYIMYIYIRI
jgi:hypothetical protein